MQTRRLNEALIGLMALGKAIELGRQLVLVTDSKTAGKQGQKLQVKPESLQAWGTGYIAFDSIISVAGILAMVQGMRRNRQGAGQASLLQGVTTILYGLYYMLHSVVGLKGAKGRSRLINLAFSIAQTLAGVRILRFARRALAK